MAATARRLPPLLLLLLLSALAASNGEDRVVDERCLECLCEANGCHMEDVCVEGKPNCGPFYISRPFWKDGGEPVIPGDLSTDLWAFERCADDPFCSAKAVEAYMKRYKKDCNSDGSVDCMDFMLIHHHGPGACNGDTTVAPIRRFISCWNSSTKPLSNSTTQTLTN